LMSLQRSSPLSLPLHSLPDPSGQPGSSVAQRLVGRNHLVGALDCAAEGGQGSPMGQLPCGFVDRVHGSVSRIQSAFADPFHTAHNEQTRMFASGLQASPKRVPVVVSASLERRARLKL
jgi:hypothetical protein